MRRKRERQPHPDPRTEIQLQAIIALQRSAARNEALSSQYAREIGKLHRKARGVYQADSDVARIDWRIATLQNEIRDLEASVCVLHDQISSRMAQLSDTDIAFLEMM